MGAFKSFDFPYATTVLALSFLAVAAFVTGPALDKEELPRLAWTASERPLGDGWDSWQPFFVSMFVHGNLIHLLFNTASLVAYGVFLERAIGPLRMLIIFLLAGIAGHLAHGAARPDTPIVGASGAIFGLMGVLVVLQPRAEAEFFGIPMPLLLFAALYTAFVPFLTNITNVLPLAHEAHLGGMFLGVATAFVIRPRRAFFFAPGIGLAFASVYRLVDLGFKDWPRIFGDKEPLDVMDWFWLALVTAGVIIAFSWVKWVDTSYREARCPNCKNMVSAYNLRRTERLEPCGRCGVPVRLARAAPVQEEAD